MPEKRKLEMMLTIEAFIAVMIAIILFKTCPCFADMTGGYARIQESFGENAEKYTQEVSVNSQNVHCIWCEGEDASVYTETNIRQLPESQDVPVLATVGPSVKVKIWGYTNNEWCKVWVRTAENENIYGYIKADLLNPGLSQPEEKPEGEAS